MQYLKDKIKRIDIFRLESGKEPYTEWLEKLDKNHQITVIAYISRLFRGITNNIKKLKDQIDLYKLRIMRSPGYRIYFGINNNQIILLLCGGSKKTQKKDIMKAADYWFSYLKRKDHEKN